MKKEKYLKHVNKTKIAYKLSPVDLYFALVVMFISSIITNNFYIIETIFFITLVFLTVSRVLLPKNFFIQFLTFKDTYKIGRIKK